MNLLTTVILIFAVLGSIDYISGNKFGIGKEFEKGINMLGLMMLSMTGMLILAPFIAHLLKGVVAYLPEFIDPSIITSSLLANDMGGASLSKELCRNASIGAFNGMVVSAMMGCTISFTIPVALTMIEKDRHKDVIFGILCGIVTIPLGCFVGGLVSGIDAIILVINLIPLVVFSLIVAFGLLKFPNQSVKILSILGAAIKILIIIGLVAGIIEFLSGAKIIPYTDSMENATRIIVNASCVMAGSFPLINILSRLLKKSLKAIGKWLGINETAAMGFVSSLATNITTCEMIKDMDKKGIILNSAFMVSGAFVFAGHLAFTMAFNSEFISGVICGKLFAGICAVILANMLYKKK